MPFLRVIRDKRGYETTYLMHWYREGGRQRSRILYVFRTPGSVRVGRDPFERDILREIERAYPDIEFDWPAIMDNQQVVEPAAETRRTRRRRRPEEQEGAAAPPAAVETPPEQVAARPSVPSAIEGATPDEQIAFLAEWYPRIRERILQRMADPARREALLAVAERLNSSTWTDADQIAAGLQSAADALERLSKVLGKRRRRARRGRKPEGATAPDGAGREGADASDAPALPDKPSPVDG